jgi:sugar lactone lactonase YvrE
VAELTVLVEGLSFPEAPRWREGRLFFSDFYTHEVVAVDLAGKRELVAVVPGQPSGLGWLPDGRLLVVSMVDRKLLRLDSSGLATVADLSALAGGWCNDMVVDREGRAYVGNFGFERYLGEKPRPAKLIRVDPDGAVGAVADDLHFPNGMVITANGRTLIVGESRGRRLTAFDIGPGGELSGRRLFADLAPNLPDGICLDAEGAVWLADPLRNELIRIKEGGKIAGRISTGDRCAVACMLGGPDGRTLFICTNTTIGPEAEQAKTGRIELTRVDVPHAGLP